MELAELKAKVLELLRTDEEFRLAAAGLIGLDEVLRAIRALQEEVADNSTAIRFLQKQVAALQEQVADNTTAIKSLQEQMVILQKQVADNTVAIRSLQEQMVTIQKQVADNTVAIKSLQEQVADNTVAIRELREDMNELRRDTNKGFDLLRRHIDAIGARWGILAESAFREGMRGVVERYFGGRVERWAHYDEEGFVLGYPCVVEVDMLIRDGEHILIEVKSSVSRADAIELWRIGQLYERIRGVKPRLAIVSPFVREEAKEAAGKFGIEVCTGL